MVISMTLPLFQKHMTPLKAAIRYEIAYNRYITGGYFLKLREFCREEGIYYHGFILWAKENDYYLSNDRLKFDHDGVIFKIDLI